MDERSPSSSTANGAEQAEPADNGHQAKQAACLSCRRSKTRCLRSPEDQRCRRCVQTDAECVIPDYHVGRKKGIKNKRSGLDKAVYRIEQAIKKSRTHGGQPEDHETAMQLQRLLREAQNVVPASPSSSTDPNLAPAMDFPKREHSSVVLPSLLQPEPQANVRLSDQNRAEDHFALDDAENPLQLLARASDLTLPPPHQLFMSNLNFTAPPATTLKSKAAKNSDLSAFFGPFRQRLDLGEDIDPIEMGFVTLEESEELFKYFYQNLSHTRWGLDPLVHTAAFCRSRSAFLFTSVLAASALFLPSAAALSKRLSIHCKKLAKFIVVSRSRSAEIVLAFMVNIPWMSPGKHWADDETCSYMAMALTVALDLSLDKLIVPSLSFPDGIPSRNLVKSDCITARKALDLDGFNATDPTSAYGQRLLRRRERIWLALFVLDRGVCLARGRSFTVPVTALIETCDNWHSSDMADVWDTSIVSSAVMRRDLVPLIANIKAACDSDRAHIMDGSSIAQLLQDMIENFFSRWYSTWAFSIPGNENQHHHIPPYVEILVCHTRLSTYSSVINHPTAPPEVKSFFRAAGLSSALNVMRAAVQGESRLKSMPNNTVIMISFAACFALCLSTMSSGSSLSLAPSIRILIEETADVLIRIGSTPAHRNGTSALYGRHLREVVSNTPGLSDAQNGPRSRQDSTSLPPLQTTMSDSSPSNSYLNINGHVYQNTAPSSLTPQSQTLTSLPPGAARAGNPPPPRNEPPLQFSAMSDYQIIEAINNAGEELETCLPGFQIDDRTGLDWLDWFNLEVGNDNGMGGMRVGGVAGGMGGSSGMSQGNL